MKKMIAMVMLLMMLLSCSNVALPEGGNTPQEKLDYGIFLLESYLRNKEQIITIEEVIAQFNSAGRGMPESFVTYCEAIQCIDKDDFDLAKQYIMLLQYNTEFQTYIAGEKFGDSLIFSIAELEEYCRARELEHNGNLQEAMKIYAAHSSVYDSGERSKEIMLQLLKEPEKAESEESAAASVRLSVSKQPRLIVVPLEETAVVDVLATGEGLTYQWYWRNEDKETFSKSSVTGAVYSVKMVEEKSGREVYCAIVDQAGNLITSDVFVLIAAEDTETYQRVALEMAYQLEIGEAMLDVVTLTGEVTVVHAAGAKDGVSVTMACAENTQQAVICNGLSGQDVKSIAVGDQITVTGTLKNNNGIVGFDTGCTLTALSKAAEPEKTWGAWSEWTSQKPEENSTTQVEKKTQYRSRSIGEKEVYADWGSWGSWSATAETASATKEVETKTQYRYRNLSEETQYGEWSAWSEWSTTAVSETNLKDVETKTESKTTYTYSYKHWTYKNTNGNWYFSPSQYTGSGYTSGTGKWEYKTTTSPLPKKKSSSSSQGYGNGDEWWYHETKNTNVENITYYRYRTRTSKQVSVAGEWSDWSDTAVSASSKKEVEKRTVYRSRTRDVKMETTYGSWSSWTDKYISKSDKLEVKTRTVYRYRKLQ